MENDFLKPFSPKTNTPLVEMVLLVLLWMKAIRSKIFHRLENWTRVTIKLLWLHLLKALEIRLIENPFWLIRPGVRSKVPRRGISSIYILAGNGKKPFVKCWKQGKKETFQLLQAVDRKVWGKYYLEPCCKVERDGKFCVRNFAWLSWSHYWCYWVITDCWIVTKDVIQLLYEWFFKMENK